MTRTWKCRIVLWAISIAAAAVLFMTGCQTVAGAFGGITRDIEAAGQFMAETRGGGGR